MRSQSGRAGEGGLHGDLSRVRRVVRLGVFVNSTSAFTDQPKVANGASDLMVEIFGEAGRHARSAVGVNVLPLGVAVEVDGIFEIDPPRSPLTGSAATRSGRRLPRAGAFAEASPDPRTRNRVVGNGAIGDFPFADIEPLRKSDFPRRARLYPLSANASA